VRTALAVSSGKAALTLALLALARLSPRRKVIIPAYTCYSVPSSIVKARLEVVPCDLDEGSFDYDYSKLASLVAGDVLCVVSVHLFGIPSDTARLKQFCLGRGVFVIEDAAQALGGVSGERKLGTIGDVGVFSLGRGKNLTSGSGGVIVTDSEEITTALKQVTASIPRTTLTSDVGTFATLLFLSWFIQPRLYWLPAGLPFLRLGETIFHEDFPVRWLSDFQAEILQGWQERLQELDVARRAHSEYYSSNIDATSDLRRIDGSGAERRSQPAWTARGAPLLRFPVLLANADVRRRVLVEQGGIALGMSGMYPGTVARIPQLSGMLAETRFPRAEAVADSLVTLPTHPLVSERDRAKICALMNGRLERSRNEERVPARI
jgi:dTDP-4-amino-4,6-dideoxygalactose transaminase